MELKSEDYMWDEFTDNELYNLCFGYGIESECVMLGNRLINREEVEAVLTAFEHDLAFNA
jgi:hypothetical protein